MKLNLEINSTPRSTAWGAHFSRTYRAKSQQRNGKHKTLSGQFRGSTQISGPSKIRPMIWALPSNSFELLCVRTTSEVWVFPSLCAEFPGVTAPFHARPGSLGAYSSSCEPIAPLYSP